jgi:hypothetical protein
MEYDDNDGDDDGSLPVVPTGGNAKEKRKRNRQWFKPISEHMSVRELTISLDWMPEHASTPRAWRSQHCIRHLNTKQHRLIPISSQT